MARTAPLQAKSKAAPKVPATPVQTKLSVGPARDRFEAEADSIADRVSARSSDAAPSAAPAISRLPMVAVQRAPTSSGTGPKDEIKDDTGKPLGTLAQRVPSSNAASVQSAQSAKRKPVKTAKIKDDEEDKSTTVQRKADGPSAAPASTEHSIGRMRAAGGTPMSAPVQRRMEGGMGRNLSDVRVHDGAGPSRAAKSVGARAFTVGNDVFFGAGQYRPDTSKGSHLLAHELVHTQQQKGLGNMAQTKALQRNPTDPDPPTDPAVPVETEYSAGSNRGRMVVNPAADGGTLYIPTMSIPTVRGATKGTRDRGPDMPSGLPHTYTNHPDQSIRAGQGFTFVRQSERVGSASGKWRTDITNAGEQQLTRVHQWNRNADSPILNSAGQQVHYLRLRRDRSSQASNLLIAGTEDSLANAPGLQIPLWSQGGNYVPTGMQVDHVQELQLGGFDGEGNFWVFAGRPNASSGGRIRGEFNRRVSGLLDSVPSTFWDTRKDESHNKKAPSVPAVKMNPRWRVEFESISGQRIRMQTTNSYWTRQQIVDGDHLPSLRELSVGEVAAEGLITQMPDGSAVTPSKVSVFRNPTGGFRRRFRVTNSGVRAFNGNNNFFGGFNLTSAIVNPDPAAVPRITGLEGELFRRRNGQALNPTPLVGSDALKVDAVDGMGFSGAINQDDFSAKLQAIPKVQIANASPITFEQAGIDGKGDIFARGYVTATKALFPAMEFPIFISGNDIYIEFQIPTDKLNFGPVSVTEAALQLGVGENGVFVEGNAALAVEQLGTGEVSARIERGNTILSGAFNFELDFLDPASAEVVYNYGEDTLTLTLNAGVGEGKLPGVESGSFTATFSREAVSFSGSMVLGGALSGVVVTASYSAENGLRLGADNIQLPVDRVPGVSSATASLYASRNPETGEWTFGGAGTAVLAMAGATGTINISVDGDKILLHGNLAVSKGPASGSISFTATNAPMDEEGNPIDGEVNSEMTVFGRGDAEVTFGSVLKGTAGIELTPEANIILRGTIGLPPTFEVFPKQEYKKDLLTVETPDFPIWGVSLGGVGIGIFAFADATLSFNAFVGPGMLVDTQIGAEMDLDRPADATITGSARFSVPAYAGFKLDIGGGLRARAAVAFVEGRVGLDAELGIAADASASVDVAWNRTDGLNVEAEAEANAQPKFRVGVNASVTAGVDLLLTEISKTWGPWRKTLGEFGPNMSMGITIPVKWNEQTGIDFSMDDIDIRKPEFNVKDILKSSFEELV